MMPSGSDKAHCIRRFIDSIIAAGSHLIGGPPRTTGSRGTMSLPQRGDTHWLKRSRAGGPTQAPWTSSSARRSSRVFRDQSGVSCQDLLLVPYNRFLVPKDLELIPDHHGEALLIIQNLRLVPDDHRFVCDDRLLVLERRLCHWWSRLA